MVVQAAVLEKLCLAIQTTMEIATLMEIEELQEQEHQVKETVVGTAHTHQVVEVAVLVP
jgi:FtsZ-binding cell division protein ZapB